MTYVLYHFCAFLSSLLLPFLALLPLFSVKRHIAFTKSTQTARDFLYIFIICKKECKRAIRSPVGSLITLHSAFCASRTVDVLAAARSLQYVLSFSVGAIHESPVFIRDNRSFSGRRGRRPLQKLFLNQSRKCIYTFDENAKRENCLIPRRGRRSEAARGE